jgi:hypothetical protein
MSISVRSVYLSTATIQRMSISSCGVVWFQLPLSGDMSEHYGKFGSDQEAQFRRDVAASVGYGFTLPGAVL